MKKKIIIGALGVLVLALVGGGVAWLNHAGYIHLWKTAGKHGDSHEEQASGIDVTGRLRKLFDYQDKAVNGDAEAIASQDELSAEISGVFQDFKPADWREQKNVNAVMAYVLSGGDTEAVESFLKSNAATDDQRNLAKGILSFALGRPKTALKQVGNVDPRALELPVSSAMSLALASLHASEDKPRSLALYDEARLHAPGTAVEEAALKRQFSLLLKAAEPDRAVKLLSRYVRVFAKSLYAPAFFKSAAAEINELDEPRATALVKTLAEALGEESDDRKYELFLEIAKAAVMQGRVALAKAAADLVKDMAGIQERERSKARLYAALATAPTEAAESALGELNGLSSSEFEPDDAAVRSAAATIARSIVGASTFDPNAVQPTKIDNGKLRQGENHLGGASATMNRADAAIKQADKLLATGAP